MKPINVFAALLLFALSQNILTQEPDPLSFFPHSVGNIWEYSTPNGIQRIQIIKDSLDINGNRYLFYGSIFDPRYCLQAFTNTVIYAPTSLNWIHYKLDADSGDSWMVRPEDSSVVRREALVEDTYTGIIFGKPSVVMQIGYYDLNPGDTVISEFSWKLHTEWLASGFGLLEVFNVEPPQGPQKILIGCIIDKDTFGIVTTVERDLQSPDMFRLHQNYPNPFNPTTTIKYDLPKSSVIKLSVYNLLGEEIKLLEEGYKQSGSYETVFDASHLPSGVYICRLVAENYSSSKKMILLK